MTLALFSLAIDSLSEREKKKKSSRYKFLLLGSPYTAFNQCQLGELVQQQDNIMSWSFGRKHVYAELSWGLMRE